VGRFGQFSWLMVILINIQFVYNVVKGVGGVETREINLALLKFRHKVYRKRTFCILLPQNQRGKIQC